MRIKKLFNEFVRNHIVADDPHDTTTQGVVQEALAEQVQKELDNLDSETAHLVAVQVQPPYYSGSPEQVRTLTRQFRGSMG